RNSVPFLLRVPGLASDIESVLIRRNVVDFEKLAALRVLLHFLDQEVVIAAAEGAVQEVKQWQGIHERLPVGIQPIGGNDVVSEGRSRCRIGDGNQLAANVESLGKIAFTLQIGRHRVLVDTAWK